MEYETVQIEKTANVCPLCEDYAKRQASKPVVVMSCEGGCLRGKERSWLEYDLNTQNEWAEIWSAPPQNGWCLVEPQKG